MHFLSAILSVIQKVINGMANTNLWAEPVKVRYNSQMFCNYIKSNFKNMNN